MKLSGMAYLKTGAGYVQINLIEDFDIPPAFRVERNGHRFLVAKNRIVMPEMLMEQKKEEAKIKYQRIISAVAEVGNDFRKVADHCGIEPTRAYHEIKACYRRGLIQ